MNVAGAQSVQTAYDMYDRQSPKAATQEPVGNTFQTDRVNISDEGRAAAQGFNIRFSTDAEAGVKSILAQGGYARIVDVGNGKAVQLLDAEGNQLPIEDYAAFSAEYSSLLPQASFYFENGKIDQRRASDFSSLSQEEHHSYMEYLSTLGREISEEHNSRGIISHSEYNKMTDEMKDNIYQAVFDRLSSDPRAKELMELFNKNIY
ncbi:hypothetical protein [uncultured Desulfuromonas sp.]|uniref:hypothetical protein n=1 Tax=uncultured Desulfuromonas sp. TaxID=181013 RepID=UPI002AABDA07|nr:hypothetical protein [uncultured Desulfuromonas sp.]